jgi:hypothetical protein
MWGTYENIATDFRNELKDLEAKARAFSGGLKGTESIEWDKWECIAQSILAMRHLEDARMRYWKVIQYLNDWESIYDKK